MLTYSSLMGAISVSDYFAVIAHGLSMDMCMAAYFTVIPGILLIASIFTSSNAIRPVEKAYFALSSFIIVTIATLDLILYGYWGFRLDMTPFFYFATSPSSALASAQWWQLAIALLSIAALTALAYLLLLRTVISIATPRFNRRVFPAVILTLLTALLFIPIRGGITVSTMNLSRAYFSQNQRLNHAAINPVFSLMYAALHNDSFDQQYRFMDDSEANSMLEELNRPIISDDNVDSLITLKSSRPDIYLIILESFSAHLFPSLGGENVAVKLDSLARDGIMFTNFYANSFRTDRALPAIISGFPSQPSTSIMKYVDKTENLPSLPELLKNAGYELSYYYGGDANFTNMQAYLINSGFEKIISDKDFPLTERTGKWGAHDHLLFRKVLDDVAECSIDSTPHLRIIQTSSSHEPFEVPYRNTAHSDSPQKNAFAYTDSCTFAFVDSIRRSPLAARSLFIIVPDHYGAYPQNIESPLQRHRIPLIMVGDAIASAPRTIPTIGCQSDIAATLLAMLGIDNSALAFSKDILDPRTTHYAVFTEPSLMAIVAPADTAVFNCDADAVILQSGPDASAHMQRAHAYLQQLYTTISNL